MPIKHQDNAPWSQTDTFDFGIVHGLFGSGPSTPATPTWAGNSTPSNLPSPWQDEGAGNCTEEAHTSHVIPHVELALTHNECNASPIGSLGLDLPFKIEGWLPAALTSLSPDFSTADLKVTGNAKPGGGGSGGSTGGTVLTSYVSGSATVADSNEFNIRIEFTGTWTAKQQAIVIWAADYLSQIITADVRDDTDLNGKFVDDVVITMNVARLDGNGSLLLSNTVAQTQITAVRDPGSFQQWIPVTSTITLDSVDLKNSVTNGWSAAWDDIILHEMIHAIGFHGVVFDGLDLVDAQSNFTGSHAIAA